MSFRKSLANTFDAVFGGPVMIASILCRRDFTWAAFDIEQKISGEYYVKRPEPPPEKKGEWVLFAEQKPRHNELCAVKVDWSDEVFICHYYVDHFTNNREYYLRGPVAWRKPEYEDWPSSFRKEREFIKEFKKSVSVQGLLTRLDSYGVDADERNKYNRGGVVSVPKQGE
jgi:hypothetical protein